LSRLIQKAATPAVPVAGPQLKISDLSRLTGIPSTTLRFWSDNGLLSPHITAKGYRVFDESHVAQAQNIRRLRALQGLSIAAVKSTLPDSTAGRKSLTAAGNPVGVRLRRLREQAGLTLRSVSSETGIPPAVLASIERTSLGVRIADAKTLASFFGVTLTTLMAEPEGNHPTEVVTGPEGGAILPTLGKGLRIEQLAPVRAAMDCQRWNIEPGVSSHGSYAHEGEELIYVLFGQFEIVLEETRTTRLHQGESIYFPSTTRHAWSNPGQTTTVLMWVNTPPTF
jgi:DNA-binding transcriptional MerR regulator/mannose-6-phosphate isomerase-like protein (cupin superfamily)